MWLIRTNLLILADMDGDRDIPDTDMSIINQFINLSVSQQPAISNKHIITMGTKGIKFIIQIKVCTNRDESYGLVRPESPEQRRSGKLSNLGF